MAFHIHDLLVEYQSLQQGLQTIRQYNTVREQKKMVLLNLGIEIDEWMDKSLWLNSIAHHLRQTIKKESGYYTLWEPICDSVYVTKFERSGTELHGAGEGMFRCRAWSAEI